MAACVYLGLSPTSILAINLALANVDPRKKVGRRDATFVHKQENGDGR
jgi:hypothetical protein